VSGVYDVIVLGGGGAGCAAAIEASQVTANILLVTSGSLQDSKTYQAQGGIQAAFGENDSVDKHCDDTLKTGQYANDAKLVRILAESANFYVVEIPDPPVGGKSDLRPLELKSRRKGVTLRARHAIAGSFCCSSVRLKPDPTRAPINCPPVAVGPPVASLASS